jgi:hypothetical protein
MKCSTERHPERSEGTAVGTLHILLTFYKTSHQKQKCQLGG